MSDAWMRAEDFAENGSGGALLKHGGRWYECSQALWQFSAWPELEFQVRADGSVCGLRSGAGLVERVARTIAEYPNGADWKQANTQQRERYERLAQQVIAMVATDVIPVAEARGRDAERADVVAWLRSTETGTRACRDWVAYDVDRGEHVGVAGGKVTP